MKMKLISFSVAVLLSGAAQAELVIDDTAPRAPQSQQPQSQQQPQFRLSTEAGATVTVQQVPPSSYSAQSYRVQSSAPASSSLSETGRRPSLTPLSGWANDVPLALALRQIVPLDFDLRENGIPMTDMVSWSGNRPWTSALSQLADARGFIAHVNWDKKIVSLAPRQAPVAFQRPAPAPTQITISSPPAFVAATPVAQPTQTIYVERVAAPVQMSAPRSAWKLSSDLTLRENVEAWVKQAGWNRVVWEGADYPIMAPAEFQGEFTSETGPLAQLIQAYESSDQPLLAKLSTLDKVVYIRNKYHERNQVVPTSPQAMAPNLFQSGNEPAGKLGSGDHQ